MATATISFEVDADAAKAYAAASAEDRRNSSLLLGLRPRELTQPSSYCREDDIGHHAESLGLTPEALAPMA